MGDLQINQFTLSGLASVSGLRLFGVTRVDVPQIDRRRLADWLAQGFHGSMHYLERSATSLEVAEARTLVSFGLHYSAAPARACPPGYGRVARYAWGRDYHQVFEERLAELVRRVSLHLGTDISYRIASDAVPLLERSLAGQAGLGFVGKNSMLIRLREGSFFFLGEVIWNVEIEKAPLFSQKNTCGTCTRCLESCPTKAFVDAFVLDSRKCISYLSIEKRGALDVPERKALGEWVFGCDVCQEVCPYNHRAMRGNGGQPEADFHPEMGVGPLLNLTEVLALRTEESYKRYFSRTALLRQRRAGLLRNAACVAANTQAVNCLPALEDAILHDRSPVVRLTCLWAYCQLSNLESVRGRVRAGAICHKLMADSDSAVRAEAQALANGEGLT